MQIQLIVSNWSLE